MVRRGKRERKRLLSIHGHVPPQYRCPLPAPTFLGREEWTVCPPWDVVLGKCFLHFLPIDAGVIERNSRLFEVTCPRLLKEGWHIHQHDVVVEYEDSGYFNTLSTIAYVHVFIRHFRADQLIIQLVVTSVEFTS